MGVIFAGSSISSDAVGSLDPGIPFIFYLAHFAEFAILAALAYWAFRTWKEVLSPRALGSAVVGFTVLYAISDEAHQAFTPGRSPSVVDLVVDTLGGIVGLALAAGLLRRVSPPEA